MEPLNKRLKNQEQTHRKTPKVGDKESLKVCILLKSCEPLSHALGPPFIGRRRDFYILILPSDLENIPNGNMYMNVFYIL
jgi:hypothetical protein